MLRKKEQYGLRSVSDVLMCTTDQNFAVLNLQCNKCLPDIVCCSEQQYLADKVEYLRIELVEDRDIPVSRMMLQK